MVHDAITNNLVKNATEKVFECRGITFSMETSQLAGKDEAKAEQKKLKDVDLETRLKLAKERQTI
jgi:hypothetical protein